MRLPTLLAAAGLLTLAAVSHSQAPPVPQNPPERYSEPVRRSELSPFPPQVQNAPPPSALPPQPVGPTDLTPLPPQTAPGQLNQAPKKVPTRPPEETVDQVLEALEHVQAQKAELEKIEKSLKDVLAKKLEQQGERVKKVGMKKDEPKTDMVPRTEILKTSSDEAPAAITPVRNDPTPPTPRR